MWLSLVERLLWEQDAAGSNPVIRTTQRELTLAVGSLCVIQIYSIGHRKPAAKPRMPLTSNPVIRTILERKY